MSNQTPIETIFSEVIRESRKQKNWTQEGVAEVIDTSPRWYQIIEKTGKLPGGMTLLRILVLYDVDLQIFRDALQLSEPTPAKRKREH